MCLPLYFQNEIHNFSFLAYDKINITEHDKVKLIFISVSGD